MDSKDTKSSQPRTAHQEVSADTDSTFNQSYAPRSQSAGRPKGERPGENIMKSDDPSTAALRAWAQDKQMQIPGSNGSFYLGQMSMGVGAVSGGPMFLPRKEFIEEPPYHSVDHGPVNVVKHEEADEEKSKKKRNSISDLFRRKGKGKSESGTELQGDVAKHDKDVVR